jgi:hypothetical protein|tara:strand:+ start:2498 stop:2638 length:141 start_codon:yes stop_codon:yes gene_type:complete
MKFTKAEIDYLLDAVRYHYYMRDDIKKDIIDINAEIQRKLHECANE